MLVAMMTTNSRLTALAAVGYLAAQGIGGLAWWGMLFTWPQTRQWFLPPEAPGASLLAFAVADLLLFAGGSLAAAYGLAQRCRWAWPVLCIHSGAAIYAALYALSLAWLAPRTWLGAALMAPSLIVPALIVWQFRPAVTASATESPPTN